MTQNVMKYVAVMNATKSSKLGVLDLVEKWENKLS